MGGGAINLLTALRGGNLAGLNLTSPEVSERFGEISAAMAEADGTLAEELQAILSEPGGASPDAVAAFFQRLNPEQVELLARVIESNRGEARLALLRLFAKHEDAMALARAAVGAPEATGTVPISPAADIPAGRYGSKAEGLRQLVSLQSEGPVPYLVPPSIAVPARSVGGYTPAEIADAFQMLTQGLTDDAVLMARSSGINERPGANPTLFVHYDPKDPSGSYGRFERAVAAVSGVSPDMGVVLTRLVGRPTSSLSLPHAIGRENVSFVADSHSALNPGEIYIAMVHGLGMRAVEGKGDFIAVTIDRERGLITGFLNQDPAFTMSDSASTLGVQKAGHYRQKRTDVYSFEERRIMEEPLRFTRDFLEHLAVLNGELTEQWVYNQPSYDKRKTPFLTACLGMTPFSSVNQAQLLIGALQFLSSQLGPIQVEGAFAPDEEGQIALYLYQLLHLPSEIGDVKPLEIQSSALASSRVIGRGEWVLPLVEIDSRSYFRSEDIERIDWIFASNGYALLADNHDDGLINDPSFRSLRQITPHARIRLFRGMANLASHSATDIRTRLLGDSTYGMMAMNVQPVPGRLVPAPYSIYYDILLWKDVHFESNGREMAAAFPERKK